MVYMEERNKNLNGYTKEQVVERLASMGGWYHELELMPGVTTTPMWPEMRVQWAQNREVRKALDYKDKLVLDMGSADGGWAFEAEALGARTVVATDIGQEGYIDRFLFAREVLGSKVIPYFCARAEDTYARLDCFFTYHSHGERFDIVQHLGLLYHLRDPFLSLSQTRKCMKTGGKLMLETTIYLTDNPEAVALLNWPAGRIYNDGSTWWAPNLVCLKAMLEMSLFHPVEESIRWIEEGGRGCGRVCLIAEAVDKAIIVDGYLKLSEAMSKHIGLELGLAMGEY